MMMKKLKLIILLFVYITANSQDRVHIDRISEKIVLDGVINENVWSTIKPLNFIQHKPVYGNKPTEKTEIRLAYDDQYLYVAGSLYDSQEVKSTSLERDGGNSSSDWFGVAIDSYNDKENATAFFTTPSGLRWDATVLDGQGGVKLNTNWNSYWDVKTTITDEGWFAEFRIPLSSLRFESINGETVMGLISWRLLARNFEWDTYPDLSPELGMQSYYKVSHAQEIVFKNIESKKPIYVTPYVLGGISKVYEHNESQTELVSNRKYKTEAGLDVKYSITSNLTLDATFNTDFAQVEADDQEINLSRFSLFFPEKRKFFQERASSFDLNFSGYNKVFHSRRIGIHNGEQVRIFGGLRLVGRSGGWDIGILNMQTEATNDLPSENLGVLRLRRQVFNQNSNIGIIATSRIGNDGSYNIVYGADGTLKVFGEDYFKFAIAQSIDKNAENKQMSLDPTRIYLNWEKRRISGFTYLFEASHVGKSYDPGLGFEDRQNYKSLNVKLKYSWLPNSESAFFQHQTSFRSLVIFNNEKEEIESAQYGPKWYFATKSGYTMQFFARINFEKAFETLYIDDNTFIPVGKYNFNDIFFNLGTPDSKPIKFSTVLEYGSFYDGKKLSSRFTLRGSLSKHFEFETTYKYNKVKFGKRNQNFSNHIGRLKTLVMLNTQISLSSFIQYNSANESISSNIRFRYNPGEGHDIYLVYNQSSLIGDHPIEEINPANKHWTLMLKYNYTFKF